VGLLALLPACSPAPAGVAPVSADPASWAATVRATIDDTTLAAGGLELPDGANVLAARIFPGAGAPAYAFYEAGGGGFTDAFYPASAIKIFAALGALDFARSLGFTGDALVDGTYSIRDYYDAALSVSSNEDYDELVRIAGVDRLNRRFLPGQGWSATAVQEPYGGEGEQVTDSPEMVLTEGNHEVDVAERDGQYDYGCDGGNCTNLFELADALRRVVLDAELPAAERFDLDPSDLNGLRDALAAAEGFIAPGVADALGPDARIFTKPGWVPGLDCVETSVVVDPTTGHRFLLSMSAPDDGTCEELATMAAGVLRILDNCDDGTALRSDGSPVAIVDGRQSGAALPGGPVRLVVTARAEGQVAGYVEGWCHDGTAHAALLVVAGDQGHLGVARHLLAEFRSEAARRGCDSVTLAPAVGATVDMG